MSAPLVLTSDGCEFSNYFSDNIKVVEDSEVALVKACMSIPVYAQQYLTIPAIEAGSRDDSVFELVIDGLFNSISWTDIYSGWFALSNVRLQQTADQFFDGTTQIPLNNNIIIGELGTAKFSVITMREIFANYLKLIENPGGTPVINWIPYDVQAPVSNNFSNVVGIENSAIVINNVSYPVTTISSADRTALKVSYKPSSTIRRDNGAGGLEYLDQAIGSADSHPTAASQFPQVNWDIRANCVVGGGGDDIRGSLVGGTATANNCFARVGEDTLANQYTQNMVDWNGGFFKYNLDHMASTGTAGYGRTNVGYWQETGMGSDATAAGGNLLELGNCVFGLEHRDYPAADVPNETWVIDGYIIDPTTGAKEPNYIGVTGAGFSAVNETTYFIRIVRTGDISPTEKNWTFQVWASENDDAEFRDSYFYNNIGPKYSNGTSCILVYQSQQKIACPQNLIMYFSTNNDVNSLDDVRYTPTITGSWAQFSTNNDLVGSVNPAYQNGVFMKPYLELTNGAYSNLELEGYRKFYNALGFAMPLNDEEISWVGGSKEEGSLAWLWEVDRKQNQAEVYYYIGKNNINDIIEFYDAAVPSKWRFKPTLTQMPRFLDVKINDLPINSFAGSYAKGGAEFTTSSVTKDVCSIPVPAEYLELENNFNMDISYEPYNLVYRQLHNVSDIPINQLQSELSFKDFLTNKLYKIPNINGTLKLEFHIHKHKC